MNENKTKLSDIPALRLCAALGVLALVLAASACGAPSTLAPTSTPPPIEESTPTSTPTRTPTPTPMPTLPPLPPLPTAIPRPTVAPTPFPDEREIVDAVLELKGEQHWITHRVGGSFTAPDAGEWLALVGDIGDRGEARWVVIGQMDGKWQLRGASDVLATGFSSPPPGYLPPDLLDFDEDAQQEMLVYYFKMQWGWMTSSDTLYRWDGHALASVWSTLTLVDNRMATAGDVPQPYREDYQAEWEWVDLDGDGQDEILLREHTTFYLPGEEGYVEENTPNIGAESGERAFRWDGEAFRPYAPDGPTSSFACVEAGALWLWQNHTAHPLGAEHVQEFHWSPDGRRLAWRAGPPAGGASPAAILGIYDLTTGDRREFSLDDIPLAFRWSPDGRLVYVLPNQPLALLDPETGQQEPLPPVTLGDWSPDGGRLAYGQDGSLYVYDLSTGQEQPVVVASDGVAASDPAWSPRGDWIACTLEADGDTYVGLVSPEPAELTNTPDLLAPFEGQEAPVLRFAWSPDGSHLAALAADPRAGRQRATIYVADAPAREDTPLKWREILQLETMTQTIGLAWSPDGEKLALAAGNEIWEATAAGEATRRQRFSAPEPAWTTPEWAPDGSGFLVGLMGAGVGYTEHLYWFPANGSDPVLLLVGFDAARFP